MGAGARGMGAHGGSELTRLVPAWQADDEDASRGMRQLRVQSDRHNSVAGRWWMLAAAFVLCAVLVGAGVVTRQRALLVLDRAAAEEAAVDLDSGVVPQAPQAACPAPITDFKLTECARASDQHALGVAGDAAAAGEAYSAGDVYNLCALPHDRAVRWWWPQHPEAVAGGHRVAGGALVDVSQHGGAAAAAAGGAMGAGAAGTGATGGADADAATGAGAWVGAVAGEAAIDDDTWAKQAQPYQIPHTPLSEKWPDVTRNKHMAFIYVFVHVVKTGGED